MKQALAMPNRQSDQQDEARGLTLASTAIFEMMNGG